MGTKGISAIAGAILVGMAFEPKTLLLKIAVAATGMAVGAVLADPLAEEAAEFKKAVQEMKAQMAQKPVKATFVD